MRFTRETGVYPGEERVFRKFLLWPRLLPVGRRTGEAEFRWLCVAYIRCEYEWNSGGLLGGDGWVEKYFVE